MMAIRSVKDADKHTMEESKCSDRKAASTGMDKYKVLIIITQVKAYKS